MSFVLPDELPGTVAELEQLLHAAEAEFDEIAAGVNEDGATVSEDRLARMNELNKAADKIAGAIASIKEEDNTRLEEARKLAEARAARTPAPAEEAPVEGEGDVVAEAEQILESEKEPVAAAAAPSFKGLAARQGKSPAAAAPAREVGFNMSPGAPKYKQGLVGYKELAASLDSMAPGTTIPQNRDQTYARQGQNLVSMSLATLDRDLAPDQIVNSVDELEAAIKAATQRSKWQPAKFDQNGAIAASAGWCAPSETLYDFCAIAPAHDLLSVPEVNVARGGLRWPNEPDFTALYAAINSFSYTESQLLTDPTKPCVEIPCPTMTEVRSQAIGLCITAGILQRRGWPELIERFVREAMKAHQHRVSAKSIADIVAGSTAVTIAADTWFGAHGSILNALALQAVNIRLIDRFPAGSPIEGFAPSWMREVMRADLTLHQEWEGKDVTDADVDRWLTKRGIHLQYVEDYQVRGAGQPGFATPIVTWPSTVQVVLYTPGTWFRHVGNVIEVGTLYDKAQLQANRYTELFTEDEYFIAKRCWTSLAINIPICVSGSVGDRERVTCNATAGNVL